MTTKADLESLRQTAPLGFTPECYQDSQGNTIDGQRAIIADSTTHRDLKDWHLGEWTGAPEKAPDWYKQKLGENALNGANQQPDTPLQGM